MTTWSEIPLLGAYPRQIKTCPHKNLHMHVYSCFIYLCPKLETIQMSLSWCMEEVLDISVKEYYLATRRDRLLHKHGWISRKLCPVKQAQLRKLHAVWVYMWHSGKGKIIRMESDQWLPRAGGGGSPDLGAAWGNLGGEGTVLDLYCHGDHRARHPPGIRRQRVEVWVWDREPSNYLRCILRIHSFIRQIFFELRYSARQGSCTEGAEMK